MAVPIEDTPTKAPAAQRVLRFVSPCLAQPAALASKEDLLITPNSRDFGFAPHGFDTSLLYGFYGTQSKLWGMHHAFHNSKLIGHELLAIDWEVSINPASRTVDEWFSEKNHFVSNIELPTRSTNEFLKDMGETLIIKSMRSNKISYFSDIWKSASERIYGAEAFTHICKKDNPDWSSPSSFCTAFPLAVGGIFRALPGFSCIVFPRTIEGRDYWFGCVLKSSSNKLITKISARGHADRTIKFQLA